MPEYMRQASISETKGAPPDRTDPMAIPPFLYKYKAFSNFLLEELCGSATYFASPNSFNDPLDSKPSIEDDLPLSDKKLLLAALLKEHKPKQDPVQVFARFNYLAWEENDADEAAARFTRLIDSEIERLLMQEIGKRGVFSLAEKWDCPLMWSHYAHNHEGLCLEYSTHDHVASNLLQVRYNASRAITLSELFDWKVRNLPGARQKVLELAFLSKAEAWNYEREWRILGKSPGSHAAPLELAGIYFGQRCSAAIQTAIVKTLCDVTPKLAFYRIHFDPRTFDLRKEEIDTDEVIQTGVHPSAALVFGRAMAPVLPPGAIPLVEPEPDEGPPYFQ